MAKEGMCTKCKEYTTVPGSCCNAPVVCEGTRYSDDDFCYCNDCQNDPDTACEMDCDIDSECEGCRLAREQENETQFETYNALEG